MSTINRKAIRSRVHMRIRKKLAGTPERPRLAVNFSNQHVYAQVIDDTKGVTLCAACTKNVELKKANKEGMPEDLQKEYEQLVQKETDAFAKKVDELVAAKEKEMLTV